MAVVPLRPDAPNTQNPFRHFHNLGWPRLIPLLPVNAPVSPKWEYVNRAIRKHGEERVLGPMWGKAPAARYSDGLWGGFKGWRTYETTDADLDRWFAWGANVGFRMPEDWIIFDIDITDADLADKAEQIIVDMLGPSPCRIGLAPKRMLFYRLTDPVNGGWVFCKAASGDKPMAVEMFSDGRQVALYGMHRAAGRPYQWPRPPIHADDLTLIRPDQYEAVQEALMAALPHSSRTRENKTADRERVSQSALRGAVEDVRRAMEAMPNGRDIFPDRMDYIRMGAALKAALPDDEEEAFDLWCEWAAKDNGGVPELWRKDWNGLGGVFSLGAQWIYEQAERLSNGLFTQAQIHFDPIQETAPSPFDMQAEAERQEQAADLYPLLTIDSIVSRPPPVFMVARHIPETSVGFLYAAPGIGKSFLAMDLGLTIAAGFKSWHGEAVNLRPNAATLYIAAEGAFDLRNRMLAWHKARGLDTFAKNFFVIEQTIRFTKQDDVEKLVRTARAAGITPALIVVDTVSRALPGVDENGQEDMTIFVEACAALQREFSCSVMGVHHTNKQGDMRGSSVLRGAGDFVMKLERKRGEALATLTMEKLKAGEDGWAYQILFEKVDLGDGQSSLVPSRPAPAIGPDTDGGLPEDRAILMRIAAAWDAGLPWSLAGNAARERRAAVILNAEFGYRMDAAEAKLKALARYLEDAVVPGKRMRGLKVKAGAFEALEAAEAAMRDAMHADGGVFG